MDKAEYVYNPLTNCWIGPETEVGFVATKSVVVEEVLRWRADPPLPILTKLLLLMRDKINIDKPDAEMYVKTGFHDGFEWVDDNGIPIPDFLCVVGYAHIIKPDMSLFTKPIEP